MKKVLSILVIAMLMLSLVGCGGNDLIGQWKIEDSEEMEALGIELVVTFTEDTMEMMGMAFDYEIKGNKIILSMMGQEEEMEFKINGDELTLIADGEEQVFIRVED